MAAESHSSLSERFANFLILGVLVVGIGAVLVGRTGPLGDRYQSWRGARAAEKAIGEHWEQLRSTTSRLDDGVAEVSLIEFADYQCPYCGRASEVVSALLDTNPTIGVAYRHLPLVALHPQAEAAAIAAICAEMQGRFRAMHSLLFNVDLGRGTSWRDLGHRVGIGDLDEFDRCRAGSQASDRLERDIALARSLGLAATPSFVGRNGVIRGVADTDRLSRLAGGR